MPENVRPGRLAYFEWSADDADPDNPGETLDPGKVPDSILDDPHAWAQANPGMNVRISEEHIRSERDGLLGRRAFAVERLGIGDWPSPNEGFSVISAEKWAAQADLGSTAVDPVCFGFAVTPNRSHAAVGVAGVRPDGTFHVGVHEHRDGTGWVAPELVSLVSQHGAVAVTAQGGTSASSALIPALLQAGIGVAEAGSTDFARASGLFYDAVDQGTLWHRDTPELRAAVKGAVKRDTTDGWVWSQQKSPVDITPLVAVTLALGALVDAGALQGGFEW